MHNLPLVTVICLCYNHEKFVIEALTSITNQTYKNIEIIVADDASNDSSVQKIKEWHKNYPHTALIINETNLGNTKTFNKALKLSNGDFIIDLAADDVLFPNCIEKQISTFLNAKTERLAIVYGNAEIISEDNTHLDYYYKVDNDKKAITKPASGDIYKAILSQSSMICSISSMIKKEVLIELNGYDENLSYEDLDIWIRTSRNYNFEFIDSVLIKKRELANSLGNMFYKKLNTRTKKINRSTYLVIRKAIVLNQTKEENKALLKRLHFEMEKAYRTLDLLLFLRYIPLELKLRFS
ncbi:glycosyltransferase family 2 protein [Flavobacterium tyrosinilyticum]|uniref:glycosyltransferase family 2 protein n=1 Tax=Flavobacterium tyrosinilyticum TaxID=1658740 RepID=UPI00203024BE|nr:glycosyltransferase family 2 protein [Flavobacterium tyrosinilyticum]MCM0666169.1 glycosyltransferase family 2 protein [Flavobacterium tyrosinilyticum]